MVKSVYLLRTKRCARFGLNFSKFLLSQVKIPDEKYFKHIYLLEKNINKPLDYFISHCRLNTLFMLKKTYTPAAMTGTCSLI